MLLASIKTRVQRLLPTSLDPGFVVQVYCMLPSCVALLAFFCALLTKQLVIAVHTSGGHQRGVYNIKKGNTSLNYVTFPTILICRQKQDSMNGFS